MKNGNSIKNIYPFVIACGLALFLLPLFKGDGESSVQMSATVIPVVLFIISLYTCFRHGFSLLLSVIVLVLSILSLKIYGSIALGAQAGGYFLVSLAGNMIGNIFRSHKDDFKDNNHM